MQKIMAIPQVMTYEDCLHHLHQSDQALKIKALVNLQTLNDQRKFAYLVTMVKQETDQLIQVLATQVLCQGAEAKQLPLFLELLNHPTALVKTCGLQAIFALDQYGQAGNLAQSLLVLLSEPDEKLKYWAVKVAGKFKNPALLPALIKLLREQLLVKETEKNRYAGGLLPQTVSESLVGFGNAVLPELDRLLTELLSPKYDFQAVQYQNANLLAFCTMRCLWQIQTPATAPLLIKLLAFPIPGEKEAYWSKNIYAQSRASLISLQKQTDLVPLLITAIKNPELRGHAVRILVELKDQRCVGVFRETLKDITQSGEQWKIRSTESLIAKFLLDIIGNIAVPLIAERGCYQQLAEYSSATALQALMPILPKLAIYAMDNDVLQATVDALHPDTIPVIEVLLLFLQSDNDYVRCRLTKPIARLINQQESSHNEKILAAFIEVLNDSDKNVKVESMRQCVIVQTMQELGEIYIKTKDVRIINILLETLKKESSKPTSGNTLEKAITIFQQIGFFTDPRIVPALLNIVTNAKHKSLHFEIIQACEKAGVLDQRLVDGMVQLLQDSITTKKITDSNRRIFIEGLLILAKLDQQQAVTLSLKALNDPYKNSYHYNGLSKNPLITVYPFISIACEILSIIKEPKTADNLIQRLHSTEFDVEDQSHILNTLFCVDSEKFIDAVKWYIDQGEKPNSLGKYSASLRELAKKLARLGGEKVVLILIDALGTEAGTCQEIPEALSSIQINNETLRNKVISALIARLSDQARCYNAAKALAKIGQNQPAVRQAFWDALKNGNAAVRNAALTAMALIQCEGTQQDIQMLISLLRDQNTAGYAAEVLIKMGSEQVVLALMAVATDTTPQFHQAVVRCLAKIGDPRTADLFLNEIRQATEQTDLSEIIRAFGKIRGAKALTALQLVIQRSANGMGEALRVLIGMANEETKAIFIQALNDPKNKDQWVRGTAWQGLARIGAPELAGILRTDILNQNLQKEVRKEALKILMRVGGSLVGATLLQAFNDPDQEIRCHVLYSLGKGRHAEGYQIVRRGLVDKESGVRSATVSVLRNFDQEFAYSCYLLALHDQEYSVRQSAMSGLQTIGTVAALQVIIQCMDDQYVYAKESMIHSLGYCLERLGQTNRAAVDRLRAYLHDYEVRIRAYAATALGNIGDPAVIDDLNWLLNDEIISSQSYCGLSVSTEARDSAVTALAKIGVEKAKQILKLAFHHEQVSICMAAASVIGEMDGLEALNDLIPLFHKEINRSSSQNQDSYLNPPSTTHRMPAILGRIGGEKIETLIQQKFNSNHWQAYVDAIVRVEDLIDLLKCDNQGSMAPEIIIKLGQLGETKALNILAKNFKFGNKSGGVLNFGATRNFVALAIGRIGDPQMSELLLTGLQYQEGLEGILAGLCMLGEARAIPAILALAGSSDYGTANHMARQLLGTFGTEIEFQWLMQRAGKNASYEQRNDINIALGRTGDMRAIEVLREGCRLESSGYSAVQALGMLGDACVVEFLCDLLLGKLGYYQYKSQVIEALGKIGDPRAVATLQCMALWGEDSTTRNAALKSLGQIGDLSAVPTLIRVGRHDMDCQAAAFEALGLLGDAQALDLLLENLPNSTNVIEAIGRIGGTRANDALLKILEGSNKYYVLESLGRNREKRAVPILIKMLRAYHGGWTDTKLKIIRALGQIGDQQAVAPLQDLLTRFQTREIQLYGKAALSMLGDQLYLDEIAMFIADHKNNNIQEIEQICLYLAEALMVRQDQRGYNYWQTRLIQALAKPWVVRSSQTHSNQGFSVNLIEVNFEEILDIGQRVADQRIIPTLEDLATKYQDKPRVRRALHKALEIRLTAQADQLMTQTNYASASSIYERALIFAPNNKLLPRLLGAARQNHETELELAFM